MSKYDVSLITPTHDRPHVFPLLERCIKRQTGIESLKVQWVVVDDGDDPVTCTMGQEYIRLPNDQPTPQMSFRRNWLELFKRVEGEQVFFIEDDDYIAPTYISHYMRLLQRRRCVGQGHARYFNIACRRYWIHPNAQHASLAQTAIHSSLLYSLQDYLQKGIEPERLDTALWRRLIPREDQVLDEDSTLHVSVKGTSKSNVGVHHQESELRRYYADSHLKKLEEWTDKETADIYRSMFPKQGFDE